MSKLWTIGCALCLLAAGAAGQDFDYFHKTYADAEKAAKKDGKPLYLHFTTTWCGWCRRIENDVYKKPEGKQALSGFACATLDCTVAKGKEPSKEAAFNLELMKKYGGSGYPFLVMLTADGVLLHKIGGYKPLDAFKQEIVTAEANLKKLKDFEAYTATADKSTYEYNAKALEFYSSTSAWAKAAEAAEGLQKLDPKFARGHGALASYALLNAAQGTKADAAKLAALEDQVIQHDPKNADGYMEKALWGRATRLVRAGRTDDAEAKAKALQQAIDAITTLLAKAEKLSDKANVSGYLGFLNFQAERFDEAIAQMKKALELEGEGRRAATYKRYIDTFQKAKDQKAGQ